MEGNANNYTGACMTAGSAKPLTAEELILDVVTPKDVMPLDAADAFLYGKMSFKTLPEIKTKSDDILKYLDRNIKDCERVISSNPGTFIPLEKLKSIRDLIEDLKKRKQQITCKDCKWRGTMKVRGRTGQEVYYCKNGYGLQQTILPENYCCMAEKE